MDASVAAILLPICPLLPTPVMISLPPCEVESSMRDMMFFSAVSGRI